MKRRVANILVSDSGIVSHVAQGRIKSRVANILVIGS